MKRDKVIIIGSGLAGLSCAFFLKKAGIRTHILEKEKTYGGMCRSTEKSGFIFDYSGHLLHFRNPENLVLVKKLLRNRLSMHVRNAWIHMMGMFIPFPFQAHFNFLGDKVARECVEGVKRAHYAEKRLTKSSNFLEWIKNRFGRGIAKYFMIPYNAKFWTIPLKELVPEGWAERFIVIPSAKDAGRGFLGIDTRRLGYSAFFWYPTGGGIGQLTKAFAGNLDPDSICLDCGVTGIDLKKKVISYAGGGKERFDLLVSTIPLPELRGLIRDLPGYVKSSFDRLRWVSILNINLGLEGNLGPSRHWIYFPEEKVPFFRVGFYHNISSSLTPSGKGSLYAEVSYSGGKPIDKRLMAASVKRGLHKTGILRKGVKIRCEEIKDIKYGYPVYDKRYKRATETIIRFMSRNDVLLLGRYGLWRYMSMEDVISESRRVADTVSRVWLKNVDKII
ncbi:MAG: FAD-dependent oxidoreductase [Candidatus Omnitrophota bacterium]